MRRVDEAMRAVLSEALAGEVSDPRIGFITVTGVRTSPDLRHARVYVSILGDEEVRQASLAGLESARGFLQRRVGGELRFKHTPTLDFTWDETPERGARIEQLLREVEE